MLLMIKSDKDGELTIAFSNMEDTGYLRKSSSRGMFGMKTHYRNFFNKLEERNWRYLKSFAIKGDKGLKEGEIALRGCDSAAAVFKGHVMDYMFASLPHAHLEILTPIVMVLGGRLWKVTKS